MSATSIPELEGDALRAVKHRGSHLQIIAAAGSGKTEVVSQRVADLLADGYPAHSIVAFTFTERAAEELKNRISLRTEQRIGPAALDLLGGLFVGTIHSYCFRILQQHVPRYETYDVLDDNQLTAFVAREANRLKVRDLDPNGRHFAGIAAFLRSVDVVENELLDPDSIPDPFGTVLRDYYATLDRYRLLTYGQQIVRAVRELERPELAALVHEDLRQLIVDEYQDVNPAQERLIELLADKAVEICVVGDDDQAIYQWRGSDVANIREFRDRYPDVSTFEITQNRRSLPQIIEAANDFGRSIPHRLEKTMHPFREGKPDPPQVVVWHAGTELDEAGWIANLILELNDRGVPFRDIAVLVRGSVAYPRLMEQLATFDIPVQPAGRTALFEQPEAHVLGRTFAWLTDIEWREQYGPGQSVTESALLDEYEHVFGVAGDRRGRLRRLLRQWREEVPKTRRRAHLVGELYVLLDELEVRSWDLTDTRQVNRLGTLARFSALLADYESVRRRARPDADVAGEQVGGQDRGDWYYKNLAIHIINYARGAYEGFDGEPDFDLDAVDLTTVHRAKGLEWPVVFVPSATAQRFPSSKTGSHQDWLTPRDMFRPDRYEGSDADERRLFYVAMTRARDWLAISRHERVKTQSAAPSPYYLDLLQYETMPSDISLPEAVGTRGDEDEPITISYSDLGLFLDCGLAFRFRNLLGFQPRLAQELGYGKAVHHILRTVAEVTRETGKVPTEDEIDGILDTSFFLPTANKPAHRELKRAARTLVTEYAARHSEDLHRIWETERPFELHLEGVNVEGRADVILDEEGGVPTALAILDYKTSTRGEIGEHGLQLQVYADAGRREGLDVWAAYVHDLKLGAQGAPEPRESIDVTPDAVEEAEAVVIAAATRMRSRDYAPNPGARCRTCEVRTVCHAAKR
jgi:DNA helicase-2/ATP-dependent DNA helicase PcrA